MSENREAEQAVAAFYHLNRSLGKKPKAADDDGDPSYERMKDRIRADSIAPRHAWERQWG